MPYEYILRQVIPRHRVLPARQSYCSSVCNSILGNDHRAECGQGSDGSR
jgi:hypothetical protein